VAEVVHQIKNLTTYDNYGVWGGREPPSSLFFFLFTCAAEPR
jgi:hypothetical protein